jgi:hypothetical protein
VAADGLREIAAEGRFGEKRGPGSAFQLGVEAAVGPMRRMQAPEHGRKRAPA